MKRMFTLAALLMLPVTWTLATAQQERPFVPVTYEMLW